MTHGSLFSGIGGFDLAAEWAGLENMFYCEINKFCQQVLKYHFPKSRSYENIKTTDFREWRGKVDVISGGFPCQPFSVAGQRKGADDDRYLWPEMLRAIREIQPTWVIGENVAGILTMVQPGEEIAVGSQQTIFGEADRERTMLRQQFVVETVCLDLEREGYSIQPFVIPACAVGAPHRRDRVWFVAKRNAASDADSGSDGGETGTNEGTCWEERIQERNEIRKSCESDYLRSESEGIATDTDGNRSTSRKESEGIEKSGRRYISQQEERRNASKRNSGLSGFSRNASYTQCNGRSKIYKEIQSKQPKRTGAYCNGDERDASYANSKVLQERFKTRRRKNKEEIETRMDNGFERHGIDDENGRKCGKSERWKDFPTVSPVCGRDDGLPFNVDSLTIPFTRWRQEAVKAYGNAIVPQVAYEIFKSINELNN